MHKRLRLVIAAASFALFTVLPAIGALAAEPNVPAAGHWIAEDPDSTASLPSIVHVSVGDSSGADDKVRLWVRDNRATGGCPATQGPAFAASVLSYDGATGDFNGTVTVWCPAEGFVFSGASGWSYDEAKDELSDGTVTYERVEQPEYIGLVDPTQGFWHLRNGMGSVNQFFYGNPGDFPILGDWDCDGDDTPGMYRQSDGFVYLRNANTQGIADIRFFFGNPGDIPIAGDFNNDGCDTVSIYRPSEGRVFIINELGENDGGLGAAELDYFFGNPGDKPFVGDFNGNGTETIGLHRESTGLVYFRNSHTQGNADNQFIYGDPGDRLVAADWINDGIDTPAIFRPSDTTYYFRFSNTQGIANDTFTWGGSSWLPVAGHFGPLSAPLCDASYPTTCIAPAPPDLACADVADKDFTVIMPDLHGFDGNNDGVGCQT